MQASGGRFPPRQVRPLPAFRCWERMGVLELLQPRAGCGCCAGGGRVRLSPLGSTLWHSPWPASTAVWSVCLRVSDTSMRVCVAARQPVTVHSVGSGVLSTTELQRAQSVARATWKQASAGVCFSPSPQCSPWEPFLNQSLAHRSLAPSGTCPVTRVCTSQLLCKYLLPE